ncbi:hypothetical protein ANN_09371 [Periplaneta americana]|uniref:Uncharacterized protein n=1 Tax=Periplaneta americana TaxID=6978 RepID=A0ABQ8TNN2_PERAM|nr:hypothetical protein ANN_09371 [Periplaneta americana]
MRIFRVQESEGQPPEEIANVSSNYRKIVKALYCGNDPSKMADFYTRRQTYSLQEACLHLLKGGSVFFATAPGFPAFRNISAKVNFLRALPRAFRHLGKVVRMDPVLFGHLGGMNLKRRGGGRFPLGEQMRCHMRQVGWYTLILIHRIKFGVHNKPQYGSPNPPVATSLMLAGSEFQSLGRAIVKEDEHEEVRWDGIVCIVSCRERVFRLWWEGSGSFLLTMLDRFHNSSKYIHFHPDEMNVAISTNDGLNSNSMCAHKFGLKLNPENLILFVMGHQHMLGILNRDNLPHTKLNGKSIDYAETVKNLGSFLDNDPNWNSQYVLCREDLRTTVVGIATRRLKLLHTSWDPVHTAKLFETLDITKYDQL